MQVSLLTDWLTSCLRSDKYIHSIQICTLDPNVLLDEARQAGFKSGRRRGQRGGAFNKIGEAQIQHAQINNMFSEKKPPNLSCWARCKLESKNLK